MKAAESADNAAKLGNVSANSYMQASTYVGSSATGKVKAAETADKLNGLNRYFEMQEHTLSIRPPDERPVIIMYGKNHTYEPGGVTIICSLLKMHKLDYTWGDIICGTLNYLNLVQQSSKNYKTNITPYTSALDKIAALNVFEYDRTDGGHHQIGLIVEDESTPEELIVRSETTEPPTEEGGEPTIKPTAGIEMYSLLCMFIQAFKEQKAINEELQTGLQLAVAEIYELQQALAAKQNDSETAMQLTVVEMYEEMLLS